MDVIQERLFRAVPRTLRGRSTAKASRAMADFLPPTRHVIIAGDARKMDEVAARSAHLVVTSPPYWVLKEYNPHPDQLGAISDYGQFLDELDLVWRECARFDG